MGRLSVVWRQEVPDQQISREQRGNVGAEDMATFLKKGWFLPRFTGTFIQQSFLVKVELSTPSVLSTQLDSPRPTLVLYDIALVAVLKIA